MTTTPIYDALAVESEWTPDDLRPPFDLDGAIARSYEHSRRKRQSAVTKARIMRRRKNRRTPPTRSLP